MPTAFTAVIAYDDGSTDDTVAVARSLGLNIITPNANGGVSRARNRLAQSASTTWIHFHDADDRIAPDFLDKLSPLADDSVDVISCNADWENDDSGELLISWRYDPAALVNDPASHLLARPLGLNNSIIRRSAWDQIGGCDEKLAMWEDADIHFRLALAGARWKHVPEVLTWSLRNQASFSHDYRRNWLCRLQALEKYASLPEAARLAPILADQAERAAAELLTHHAPAEALRALDLNRSLGGDAPVTAHPLLRIAKLILPRLTVLRLQNRRRST